MKIIWINPEVTQGTKIHSLCGRSGKIYARTTYSGKYSCHASPPMTEDEYKKSARDILSNKIALQGWIPMFILEESDLAPAEESPLLAEILALLEPHALDTDQTPTATLQRLLASSAEQAARLPEEPAPGDSANLPSQEPHTEDGTVLCITDLSTQKLRALAKQRGIDVAGKSRPEMIDLLNNP